MKSGKNEKHFSNGKLKVKLFEQKRGAKCLKIKKMRYLIIISFSLLVSQITCTQSLSTTSMENKDTSDLKVKKSEEEWRQILTPAQYNILRLKGTERAFTGKYYNFFEKGSYYCAACGSKLFDSATKFESGCGWPSFYEESKDANIKLHKDTSLGMLRTEVTCGTCGSHLGHVFDDGPKPTGKRYCINSESIKFVANNNSSGKK
jgi:peptide-methionine (R)-S-oxide reductase